MAGPEICVTPATMPAVGAPGSIEALLLLSKPGIVLAEVLAGLAGMLLAAPAFSSGPVIAVLLAIASVAAGAAMLNGVLDAAADRRMARLVRRCQALEMIGRGRVLIIALSLIGLGLGLAVMTVPLLALFLLAGGCLAYLWLYTGWLKYRSPWGVLAGGISGAVPTDRCGSSQQWLYRTVASAGTVYLYLAASTLLDAGVGVPRPVCPGWCAGSFVYPW